MAELDKLFKRIYEDMVNGKLSEVRFQMLSDDYEQEQEELRAKIEMIENEIQNQEEQAENVDRFIRVAKKHLYLKKLNPDVLNDMVQAVYVHALDNSSGQRIQDVDISYNYIGILPANLLYDIKKIQKKQVLSDGMTYDYIQKGMSPREAQRFLASKDGQKQEEYIMFAQEKYSNGETSLQYFEEYLQPSALYLLDEPEVSLSPANQVALAEEINKMARLLQCQFIIATHSPFMLGTLNAKIYNLDKEHICCAISNNNDIQVSSKKAWLSERFEDGLVFLKSTESQVLFKSF